jgi:DNA primase
MNGQSYDLNKDFIEEVRSATDIVRVIGRHVQLRQRGRNFVGLCPFHGEKTPSFNVQQDRQMFYCFGCGAGGDVYKFLMMHDNMTFPDAVVELAREAGIRVPLKKASESAEEGERGKLVEANEAALAWFRANLREERGAPVREYLSGRGLSQETIDVFEFGYAPDGYDGLQQTLKSRFPFEILEKAGLAQVSSTSARKIDRFHHRLMIPIRSAGGRLVSFGGRIIGEGEPKYLNGPETAIFQKGRTLFGLQRGMKAIRKRGFAILVEGYFDVIALHAAGIENTVAPLGTSLTEEQTVLLKRYTEKVIVCLDADNAGRRAAVRSADLLLGRGFTVNVMPLPAEEDPDTFVQKVGAEGFNEALKRSEPAYRYVLKYTLGKFDLSRPVGKREAMEELLPMLARIVEPIERGQAVQETAQALGIDTNIVIVELRRLRRSQTHPNQAAAESRQAAPAGIIPAVEKELLLAAAQDPAASQKAVEELEIIEYVSPFTRRLLAAIWRSGGGAGTFADLTEQAGDDAERRFIAELAVSGEDEPQRASVRECAVAIAVQGLRREMATISARIEQLERAEPSSNDIDDLFGRKVRLSLRINELESGANALFSRSMKEMTGL